MTIRQIIEQNQLPINMRNGKAMSVLGNYVRDEIFGVGNPVTFDKVEENNNMVNAFDRGFRLHKSYLLPAPSARSRIYQIHQGYCPHPQCRGGFPR